MKFVKTALQDADVLLVVTEVNEEGMAPGNVGKDCRDGRADVCARQQD